MIRWYVNRLHVSTPDEEVADDIGERAIGAGWHPLAAIAAVAEALDVHHANQRTYAAVVSGRLDTLDDDDEARWYGRTIAD